MPNAVQIFQQGDSAWLGFDLREVMDAVGPHPDLTWVLRDAEFNGDVRAVWSEGWETVQRQSDQPSGVWMTWAEMRTLGETCQQIIDGCFTGYDSAGKAQLLLRAMDSTYWIVWSRDDALLEAVGSRFTVVAYEEPVPDDLSS